MSIWYPLCHFPAHLQVIKLDKNWVKLSTDTLLENVRGLATASLLAGWSPSPHWDLKSPRGAESHISFRCIGFWVDFEFFQGHEWGSCYTNGRVWFIMGVFALLTYSTKSILFQMCHLSRNRWYSRFATEHFFFDSYSVYRKSTQVLISSVV